MLKSRFGRLLDATAAGHFHTDDGDAFDIVMGDDLGQLLAVIFVIQFGAADEGDVVFDKATVKIAVGKGSTVGGYQ